MAVRNILLLSCNITPSGTNSPPKETGTTSGLCLGTPGFPRLSGIDIAPTMDGSCMVGLTSLHRMGRISWRQKAGQLCSRLMGPLSGIMLPYPILTEAERCMHT